MKRALIFGLVIIALVGALIALTWNRWAACALDAALVHEDTPSHTIVSIEDVEVEVDAPGFFESQSCTSTMIRVSGTVTEVHFQRSDYLEDVDGWEEDWGGDSLINVARNDALADLQPGDRVSADGWYDSTIDWDQDPTAVLGDGATIGLYDETPREGDDSNLVFAASAEDMVGFKPLFWSGFGPPADSQVIRETLERHRLEQLIEEAGGNGQLAAVLGLTQAMTIRAITHESPYPEEYSASHYVMEEQRRDALPIDVTPYSLWEAGVWCNMLGCAQYPEDLAGNSGLLAPTSQSVVESNSAGARQDAEWQYRLSSVARVAHGNGELDGDLVWVIFTTPPNSFFTSPGTTNLIRQGAEAVSVSRSIARLVLKPGEPIRLASSDSASGRWIELARSEPVPEGDYLRIDLTNAIAGPLSPDNPALGTISVEPLDETAFMAFVEATSN